MKRRILLALCVAAAWPVQVHATQDTVIVVERGARLDASSRVAREAIDFFNDRATTRSFGPFTVSSDEVINGDVAVYGGPVRVSGVIRGDLVVINSDLRLSSTAVIQGEVLVIGGFIRGLTRARIDGNTRVYGSRASVRRAGNRLVLQGPIRSTRRSRRRRSFTEADASLILSTGGTYNRVEGLPIHFGPRIEWRTFGSTYLRLEGFAILRTAGDFENNREDLGFTVGAEWTIFDSPVTLGGRGYDVVVPIEDWQLHDDEIGFASLLWHRDYRDYFFRRGFMGFIRIKLTRELAIVGEMARNEETSAVKRDPWTPFHRDDIWRPNPRVDEGTFTTITSRIEWDSRPYRGSHSSGWFLSAEWERGMSDDVVQRVLPTTIRTPLPAAGYTYDRLFVDVRRYERIGRNGQLSLRAVGAGIVGDNDPLPIQRRLSLGGPDPMPGFDFRHLACNTTLPDLARPGMCDRIVLFQAEYRGHLSFNTRSRRYRNRHGSGRRDNRSQWDWDDWYWLDGPTIVLFGNAGTGWIQEIDDGPGELDADIGLGIEFGSFGVYGAKALTVGESLKFSLRIHRRF